MKKILVVDDEPDIQVYIQSILQENNYTAKTASSGVEAIRKLNNEDFDLITLDIFMPEMDGWTVLKKIREKENTKTTPVILYTVVDSQSAFEKAGKLNSTLLPKNTNGSRLIEEIEKALKK